MAETQPASQAQAGFIETFVPVIQRRVLKIESKYVPFLEPLFLIETHMSYEERLSLFQTAMRLPPGFVACEIGSYLGASASFLATAALLRGGTVHCVDTWGNEAMRLEGLEDTYPRFRENIYRFRYLITVHRGLSAEQAPSIPENLDLLFIDGDHSYEATLSDLTNYAPKLKPGGIVALHDYTYETVRTACKEYFRNTTVVDKGCVISLQVLQVNK